MVVFDPLDDPLKVLPLPLKLLALLGVNKNPSERFRLYAIYAYLCIALFIPKLCLGYETILQCFRSIAEGMLSFNTTITFIMLPLKMDNLEDLLKNLKRFTEIVIFNEDYEQILIRLNTAIHKFTKYYFIFTNGIVFAMTSSTIAGMFYTYYTKDSEYSAAFPLVMENRFYVLDSHYNLGHCFVHQALMFFALYILLVMFTAKAGTLFGLIRFCSTVLGIIVLKIERLSQIGPVDQYTAELSEIIELHQLVIKCSRQLQNILMEILLAQFTGCVFIWCFMLYYVMISGITAEGIAVGAMLIALSTETFIFCLLGNELTLKGLEISTAMYFTNWYDQPVKLQKMVVPIIQQSQQRIGITAAKFYYIDYNRYGQSLKTAYSFYLLLKDIF
uniref:Odorant receptor n=1 Tax=Anopheles coluzzii TaxID=1518534 RepID=A0A8W7Q4G4_ANOCL